MQTNKGMIIGGCVIFLLGLGLGAWASYSWFVPDLRADASKYQLLSEFMAKQPLPIKETATIKTVTEIQYVDKLIDPGTGQKEKTDVQLATTKPVVGVKVNGQSWQFDLKDGETQKFENGKVVLDQNSSIGIDLDVRPMVAALAAEQAAVIKKRYDKPNGTGALYTSDGWQAIQIRRLSPSFEVVAEVTLPDPGKHIGGGLIYRY